jgi:outer membrane protein OmpA-like peptidoglycan-associated protein
MKLNSNKQFQMGVRMKLTKFIILLAGAALVSGCASKGYVEEQIRASESRTSAQLTDVSGKATTMEADIEQLKALSRELSSKTDMAINQAKGFENYQIIWEGEVNFDFDSYDIKPVAEQTLMEAGQKLEQNRRSLVELVGHTDQTGTNKYNLMLGERRAESVKRFLADKFGISLYRMFTLSYGKEKPLEMPDQANASAKNRRVKIRVWGELT